MLRYSIEGKSVIGAAWLKQWGLTALWGMMALIGAVLLAFHAIGQSASRGEAIVLTLNGAVSPASADYLVREINAASQAQKELTIIEIDTPGGLVTSMEAINKAILASDTPVVTYVSPQGAKSASAGLYIMYAAHISAMAPATNTGSATPIQLGGGGGNAPETELLRQLTSGDQESETIPPSENVNKDIADTLKEKLQLNNDTALHAKMVNNSVAYIQSLAELRGRNGEWAEKAVREAANITSTQALEMNVIDLIASDMADLLDKIDGRQVVVKETTKTINTNNIIVTRIAPTFAEKILGFFADPNVAAILMSLGMLGLTVELWNPGSIFPGVVGVLCLSLGLYASQLLPFSWLGVGLIIGGIFLIVLEAYTPTMGVVGFIGLVCFAAGLYLLFPETLRVSGSVILASVAIAGGILAFILFAIVGSRSHGPLLGAQAIKNREGVVDDWDGNEGYVIVEGERWQARSSTPLEVGDKIKVQEMDGLVLIVRKAKAESGGLLSSMRTT